MFTKRLYYLGGIRNKVFENYFQEFIPTLSESKLPILILDIFEREEGYDCQNDVLARLDIRYNGENTINRISDKSQSIINLLDTCDLLSIFIALATDDSS